MSGLVRMALKPKKRTKRGLIEDSLRRNFVKMAIIGTIFFLVTASVYLSFAYRVPGHEVLRQPFNEVLNEIKKLAEELRDVSPLESAIFIFVNNTRVYWFIPLLVLWLIPAIGILVVAASIVVNGGLIGFFIAEAEPTLGFWRIIISLTPHGILEIPAAIFMLTAMVDWQIGILKLIFAVIKSESFEPAHFRDAIVLSALAITLFFFAAFIEAFVTPSVVVYLFR